MQILRDHIIHRLGTEPPHLETVLNCFKTVKLSKGDSLLESGEICSRVYFIQEGSIHVYSENNGANLVTRNLVITGMWYADLPSLMNKVVSNETALCLSDSIVSFITKNDFDFLCHKVLHFEQILKQILIEINANMNERILVLSQYSAKQKYEWFVNQNIYNQFNIPQYIVASFLGITKETLSRIKQ
jgi:CRP-like cAMP-binding protein